MYSEKQCKRKDATMADKSKRQYVAKTRKKGRKRKRVKKEAKQDTYNETGNIIDDTACCVPQSSVRHEQREKTAAKEDDELLQCKYTSPSVVYEAATLRAVDEITEYFGKVTNPILGKKWASFCEEFLGHSWLHFDGTIHEDGSDGSQPYGGFPILPSKESCEKLASKGTLGRGRWKWLHEKLTSCAMNTDDARQACITLATMVSTQLAAHMKARTCGGSFSSFSLSKTPHSVSVGFSHYGEKWVRLSCCGVALDISSDALENKLLRLYRRSFAVSAKYSEDTNENTDDVDVHMSIDIDNVSFRSAAFCCIARYMSSMGGSKRNAGGLHAACNHKVFVALKKNLNVTFECFASPLNVSSETSLGYCSIHYDVDKPFGSHGSFFCFHPRSGSYMCNPPFLESVVARMACHIENLLDRAETGKRALSFIVIIKKDKMSSAWQQLSKSKFKSFERTLWMGEHSYCEGASFMRYRKHRMALHDSSFIALQTTVASTQLPVTEKKWISIEQAFAIEATSIEHSPS